MIRKFERAKYLRFVLCMGAPLLAGCSPAAHSILTAYAPAAPLVLEDDEPVAHLRDAESIAREIDGDHNEYAHKDCFIHWKGEDGAKVYENRTDCSDFLNLLLQHAYQISPDDLHRLTGHERPTASVWYETVSAAKGFDVIPSVGKIQAGDVIAVQYPRGGEDTGHIMIVAGEPRRRNATEPLVDGTDQWELDVIDSSKSGHGPKDTRHHKGSGFDRGVGEGTLRLYTNADGSITGYAWSVLSESKFEPADVHKIVVGRIRVKDIRSGR